MLKNVKLFKQSSIKINNIYFDPYMVDSEYHDADAIFITHSHYDHFSIDDIKKVANDDTIFIGPKDVVKKIKEYGFLEENIYEVSPNIEYKIDDLSFKTTFAYNNNKSFHPKSNGWVGYIVQIDNLKYYIAGDTDFVKENKNIKCDVAFVPIGGTYTMDPVEAANFINIINPDVVIPIHYGLISGDKSNGKEFEKLLTIDANVYLISCY